MQYAKEGTATSALIFSAVSLNQTWAQRRAVAAKVILSASGFYQVHQTSILSGGALFVPQFVGAGQTCGEWFALLNRVLARWLCRSVNAINQPPVAEPL